MEKIVREIFSRFGYRPLGNILLQLDDKSYNELVRYLTFFPKWKEGKYLLSLAHVASQNRTELETIKEQLEALEWEQRIHHGFASILINEISDELNYYSRIKHERLLEDERRIIQEHYLEDRWNFPQRAFQVHETLADLPEDLILVIIGYM